jgi:hypothetical protein
MICIDGRGTTTMRAFIPAIALCAVLQAGAAAQAPHQAAPAAAATPAGMVQAKLATPADAVVVAQHGGEAGTGKAGLATTSSQQQAGSGEEHRPTTAAMLLAALILMTGIALRRWGVGEQ